MLGLINGFWIVLGLVIFNYLFWIKIRHEVERVDSVKLSWMVVLCSLFVGKIGGVFFGLISGLRGWRLLDQTEILWPLVIAAGMASIWWWYKNIKSRWQHDMENGMFESLLWHGLIDSMRVLFLSWGSWQSWYVFVIFILQIIGVYSVKTNFRKFKLYKSGKTGFVFWTGWIVNCILHIVGVLIWHKNLTLIVVNVVLYLILLVIALIGWYKRAGRKLVEDWPGLYYWFK